MHKCSHKSVEIHVQRLKGKEFSPFQEEEGLPEKVDGYHEEGTPILCITQFLQQ